MDQQQRDTRDRHRLIRFYQKYNPERLTTIDATLQEWTGDRENLFRSLVSKYGPEPPSQNDLFTEQARNQAVERMTRYYQYYNMPDKISSVRQTVDKFADNSANNNNDNNSSQNDDGFEDLFRRLVKKYGPEPPSSWLPNDSTNNNNNNNNNENENAAATATTAVPVSHGVYPPTFAGQQDPSSQSPDRRGQQENNNNSNIDNNSSSINHAQEENFRRRLIKFWEHYDTSQMGEIERTLVQYRNREEDLFQILTQTHGPEPRGDINAAHQNQMNNNNSSRQQYHQDPYTNQNQNQSQDPAGAWGTYGNESDNTHQQADQNNNNNTMIYPATLPGLNGHTTICYGNNLVVYGGLQAPSIFNPDVFALDLTSNQWSRVETNADDVRISSSSSTSTSNHSYQSRNSGTTSSKNSSGVPAPRAFHTSVMIENKMFVFGGLLSVGIEDVHYNMHNVFAHPDVLIAENPKKFQVPHNARDRLVKNCSQKWPVTQQMSSQTMVNNNNNNNEDINGSNQQQRRPSKLRLAPSASSQQTNSALFILDFSSGSDDNNSINDQVGINKSRSEGSNNNNNNHTPTWCRAATAGNEPPTRAHHAATVYNDQMLIYGGYSVHSNGQLGDPEVHACSAVYSLNVNSLFWRRIETCHSPWPAKWGAASALSQLLVPSSSSSSSSSSTSSGPRWIFSGGVDPSFPQESNETWSLDLKSREWKRIDRPDPNVTFGPDSVAQHAAVSFGGKFYTIGGSCRYGAGLYSESVMKVMDERTGAWSTITDPSDLHFNAKECPSPRSGHTATLVGYELFIFGGMTSHFSHFPDKTLRSNELFAYNFLTRAWRKVETGFYVPGQNEDGDNADGSVIISPLEASTSMFSSSSSSPNNTRRKNADGGTVVEDDDNNNEKSTIINEMNNSRNTSLTQRFSTNSRRGKKLLGVPNAVEELMDLSRQLLDDIDKPMPPPPVEPQRPQKMQNNNNDEESFSSNNNNLPEYRDIQQNAAGSGGKRVFGGGKKESSGDEISNKPNFGDDDDEGVDTSNQKTIPFDQEVRGQLDDYVSPIVKKQQQNKNENGEDEDEVTSLRREIEELKKLKQTTNVAGKTEEGNSTATAAAASSIDKQQEQEEAAAKIQEEKERLEKEKQEIEQQKEESDRQLSEKENEIAQMKAEMEQMKQQMMMNNNNNTNTAQTSQQVQNQIQQQQPPQQAQQQQQSSILQASPTTAAAQQQQQESSFSSGSQSATIVQQQQQSSPPITDQQQVAPAPIAAPPIEDKDRQRLIRFYKKYNPTKLDEIETTLQRYAGNTETMFKKLSARYGPEPPEEEEEGAQEQSQVVTTSTTPDDEAAAAVSTSSGAQQQSSQNAFDPSELSLQQEDEPPKAEPSSPTTTSATTVSSGGKKVFAKKSPAGATAAKKSPPPSTAGKSPTAAKSPVAGKSPVAAKSPVAKSPPVAAKSPPAAATTSSSSSSTEDQIREIVTAHDPKMLAALPKLIEKMKTDGKLEGYLKLLKKKHNVGGDGATATASPTTTSGATPPAAAPATAKTKSPTVAPKKTVVAKKAVPATTKSKDDIEKELKELFQKHDPKMVAALPNLMKKAEGKELGLLGMMKKKYAAKEAEAAAAAAEAS